ncbi:hypothetical protein [Hyalangium versicolor]|uniref:hypothetical protein n=1 Tax=Hyalangium versicolor TaxID=2861190 RepID=UPI001CCDBA82|nr:hypothetical protein [Hyalangium versicolor]
MKKLVFLFAVVAGTAFASQPPKAKDPAAQQSKAKSAGEAKNPPEGKSAEDKGKGKGAEDKGKGKGKGQSSEDREVEE